MLLVLLATTLWISSPAQKSSSYLNPEHKTVVEEWLKRRPDLRLATDADNVNKDGLAYTRKERGHNYHPYYAVGDFNGDGKEDIAVAFVKKRKSEWPFVFAIFNGPLTNASKPAYITDADIADGGIMYNAKGRPSQGRLLFGTFESDNCVIVFSRRRGYATRNCLD